ncbi:hypothetical protein DSAG12_02284 [Promethearchaeum syntrophicum]|uniref:Frag1/DRAM/Sfk1 family protein n=1 Tax=Promethearchaeum syntrophicum TaxID=2594042 RepID=A0A5B9DBE1_9ARCH|nr:hypothetical protein [Candidatus Prometheoarchaeum syntrophicum]QEE16454.1 hypothetical protein DSAG12_02284 [Candidatus Prometheoarchaeum syntrophicum]
MSVPPELQDTFIGLIYESGIIFLFLILLVLIIIHYNKKKTLNTFLLLASFTFMFLAIVFSWLSKFLLIREIVPEFVDMDPNMPIFWISALIVQFRISFVVIVIASDITHILKVKIFDDTPNKVERWILIILSLFTIIFAVTAMEQGNVLLDVLAFLFVLIIMCYVYIPFVAASLKMYRIMKEPHYKRASLSLAILGLSFIMVFIGFLADRLMILLTDSLGYTPFYFAAWGFVIVGTFAAYMGYIRTSRQKSLKEEKQIEQKE